MNPARVEARGLAVDRVRAATLVDFKLVFNKVSANHAEIAHANIQFERGQHVQGVLYDLEAQAEIFKMDPYERAPWNYGRDAVLVETREGDEWCWTYFANPGVISIGRLPSADYMAHLLAGKAFLSMEYLQMLTTHPTVEAGPLGGAS